MEWLDLTLSTPPKRFRVQNSQAKVLGLVPWSCAISYRKLTQPVPTFSHANERHSLAVRQVEQGGQVLSRVKTVVLFDLLT